MSDSNIHQKILKEKPSLTPFDLTDMAYEQFEQLSSLFNAIAETTDDSTVRNLAGTGRYLCADWSGIYDCENERIRHHEGLDLKGCKLVSENIPAAKKNTDHNGHDAIILGLGEELETLYHEYSRLDRMADTKEDSQLKTKANVAQMRVNEKMNDICLNLSCFKASTFEAAAIQMRAISCLTMRDDQDMSDRMGSLIVSVLSVLEAKGGVDRNQWAAGFYLPPYDPFKRVG